jgi:hypothetical protein
MPKLCVIFMADIFEDPRYNECAALDKRLLSARRHIGGIIRWGKQMNKSIPLSAALVLIALPAFLIGWMGGAHHNHTADRETLEVEAIDNACPSPYPLKGSESEKQKTLDQYRECLHDLIAVARMTAGDEHLAPLEGAQAANR